MAKVLVECTFRIEVDAPDGEDVQFMFEDNGCPATALVGAALDKKMAEHSAAGTCWGCALQGANRVISIDGKPLAEVA